MSKLDFDKRFEDINEYLNEEIKKALVYRERIIAKGLEDIDLEAQEDLAQILYKIAMAWFQNTDLVKFAMVRNFTSNDDRVLIMERIEEIIQDNYGNIHNDRD